MKVAKWVEAPTGTFIKLSAKTGKITVYVYVYADIGTDCTVHFVNAHLGCVSVLDCKPPRSANPCLCVFVFM